MRPSELCGVVVTFHPEPATLKNLRAMVAECGRLIVVDNASSSAVQAQLASVPGVELLALPENAGVAAALNHGARRAREFGCEWIVAFDQDSTPRPGMVNAMWASHLRYPKAAIVVPTIHERGQTAPYRWVRRHPRVPGLFQRVACDGSDLAAVTMAITSGSMIDLSCWGKLGGFDDGLFIDYVDIDFCLKVVAAGRSVAVSAAAELEHELGARRAGRWLGRDFRPMGHAAFRHYYMARNRVRVWRRHAVAMPHWALFDLCFAGYNWLRVLMFEGEKWAKTKAVVVGTWDGLRGRTGVHVDSPSKKTEPGLAAASRDRH